MSVLINAGQCYVPGSLGSGSGYGIGIGYGMPTVTLNGGSAPTVASNAKAITVQLTTQGIYYCYNDNSSGQVSLTVAASNASNPRIDVVIAQVEDSSYSGSNNDWKLAVVTGTAASSPTVPSLPANALVLAYVWVPAASTSVSAGNILDLRVASNRNPFRWVASGNSGQTISGSQTTIIANSVASDISGSYSASTGLFTVPIGGLWMVTGMITVSWSTTFSNTQASALVNGSSSSPASITPSTNGSTGSYPITGVVKVDQGQTIGMCTVNVSGSIATDGRFTYFGGYLVCPT